jgi:hypothetical protein
VISRDDQDVNIRDRVNVVERHALIVGVNFGRWHITMNDVAKQAILLP